MGRVNVKGTTLVGDEMVPYSFDRVDVYMEEESVFIEARIPLVYFETLIDMLKNSPFAGDDWAPATSNALN